MRSLMLSVLMGLFALPLPAHQAAPQAQSERLQVQELQRQAELLQSEISQRKRQNQETAERLDALSKQLEELRQLNRQLDRQLGLDEQPEAQPETLSEPEPDSSPIERRP